MSKARKHERMYSSFVGNKVYGQADGRMGGRGTIRRKDVNRVGNGFALVGTDVPCIYTVYLPSHRPTHFGDRQISSERRCIFRGDCRVVVAHDGVCNQGYENGRATSGEAIVVAAFAMVLVNVAGVADAISLRVAGISHVLDVLGE